MGKAYILYFNQQRPHQGIDQSIPIPSETVPTHSNSEQNDPGLSDFRRLTYGLPMGRLNRQNQAQNAICSQHGAAAVGTLTDLPVETPKAHLGRRWLSGDLAY